jgi:hypothetical protein
MNGKYLINNQNAGIDCWTVINVISRKEDNEMSNTQDLK